MNIQFSVGKTVPAALLLAAFAASPAQASYVCTGATAGGPNAPYFNGDLSDGRCDITEVEAALGLLPGAIDESLIVGSKTNAIEVQDNDGGDPPVNIGEPYIGGWAQDEFGLGTLVVTAWTPIDNDSEGLNSGTWELTGPAAPLFWVDKYDGAYDIYTYMGGDISPFSDSWDIADGVRGTVGANCTEVNCNALTSHIAAYGVVPVPAAVWLFGSGLLGLVGIARRKKAA